MYNKSGSFPEDLKDRAIGAPDNARWLNLSNRICRAWCSEHTLPSNAVKNLKLLGEFKVKHSWIEGPNYILKQLQLVSLLPKKVLNIVLAYVESSTWNAHSENLLQTLLCNPNSGDRRFTVDTICKLCGSYKFGDISVRCRKILN